MTRHLLRNIAYIGGAAAAVFVGYEFVSTRKVAAAGKGLGSGLVGAGTALAGAGGSANCAFIPSVQYVAAYGNGYIVVIGGKQVGPIYTDLNTAQNAYNAALGC